MFNFEKIKQITIGKSAKPQYFKGVKSLPLDNESNKNV
jgi:hypothetical protein